MQLSTRHDVDMPAEALFDGVADFDRIERILIRRGAKVKRVAPSAGSPMAWDVQFNWRGRMRDMRIAVTRFDRPSTIHMQGVSDAFSVVLTADVVALSRTRSRLNLDLEVQPRTLKARLVVQTAKLTRSRLNARLSERVADYLTSLQARA